MTYNFVMKTLLLGILCVFSVSPQLTTKSEGTPTEAQHTVKLCETAKRISLDDVKAFERKIGLTALGSEKRRCYLVEPEQYGFWYRIFSDSGLFEDPCPNCKMHFTKVPRKLILSVPNRKTQKRSPPDDDAENKMLSTTESQSIRDTLMEFLADEYQRGDVSIQVLAHEEAYLCISIEGLRGEIIKNPQFWEKLKMTFVFMPRRNVIGLYSDIQGYYAPGLTSGRRPGSYSNMEETQYASPLGDYADHLIAQLESYFERKR